MEKKRSTDAYAKLQFRSDRFFLDGGKWFFDTREGTVEGPYGDKKAAELNLDNYIKVTVSQFIGEAEALEIQPMKPHLPDTPGSQ